MDIESRKKEVFLNTRNSAIEQLHKYMRLYTKFSNERIRRLHRNMVSKYAEKVNKYQKKLNNVSP